MRLRRGLRRARGKRLNLSYEGKGEEEIKLKKGVCARVKIACPGEGSGKLSWIKMAEGFK